MAEVSNPVPTEIRQKTKDKMVRLTWNTGESFDLTMEYLRVMCPCADCRGHTPDQAKLIDGKLNVGIRAITPVGRYAVKLAFDDDHDTGVYSWDVLWELCVDRDNLWDSYLVDLEKAGKRRKPSVFPIKAVRG